MAITDGRTLLSGFETGDTVTTPDDLDGAAGGTADTEIFIQGSRSFGYYSTSTRDGLLYDNGTAIDLTNEVIYAWVNCGIAGLLDTLANGGMAMRFCGATVTDWFEINVAGSDVYPAAVNGGWVMLVVSVNEAKTASDRTNGTPPAKTAIRYVGVTTLCPTMPRMADNTWLDAMWRIADNQPAIKIEGENGTGIPWTWQDAIDAGDLSDSAKAWGTIKRLDNGTIAINGAVRVGADNTTTHNFVDINETIGFENALVESVLGSGLAYYKIQVYGNAGGTTTFKMGEKTGAGDDATGAQGGAIVSGGPLFDVDLVGAGNVDTAGLYGVSIEGAALISCDGAPAEIISCQLNDCERADVSNAGAFLRNRIINAATADGVAFVFTDDISDIVFCLFAFSDGHAIELLTGGPSTQISKGNEFDGYSGTSGSNLVAASGSTDAAFYNNAAAARTVSVTSGGDQPSVRNGTSATTTVSADVSVTLTGMKDSTEVRVLDNATGEFLAGIENVVDGTADDRSFTFALGAGVTVDIAVFNVDYILPPNNRLDDFIVPSSDASIPLQQIVDRNV